MTKAEYLQWPLISGMGALALMRPILNMTGLMEYLGRPLGPLLITLLISLVWLAIVVLNRVRRPVQTLVWTGITYGVFAILLSAILSPLLEGLYNGPLRSPFAVVAVLLTNAIWGCLVGLVALAVRKATPEALKQKRSNVNSEVSM